MIKVCWRGRGCITFQDKSVKVLPNTDHSPETQKLWNSLKVSQIGSHSCKMDKSFPALCFQYTVQSLYNARFIGTGHVIRDVIER